MAKNQGKIRSWVEYAGVMLGYALLTWPPVWLSRSIAIALADVWRILDRKHRLLAMNQSMERLDIDAAHARRLVRDNYRHYGLFIMEVARLRRMPPGEVMRRTNLNGCDAIMADTLARGKGLIVVTGHIGNWEWGAVVLGVLNVVEGLIARSLDNPLVDAFIRDIRQSTGAAVWDKFGSMRKALFTLKRGGGFVAVMDQDAGKRGFPAPFLGKDGSTMIAPVELAIRTGAPLFVGAIVRNDAGDFTMIPKRVHWPAPGADPSAETQRLAIAINADLSEIIREYPEQWIWIHRRWKTAISVKHV